MTVNLRKNIYHVSDFFGFNPQQRIIETPPMKIIIFPDEKTNTKTQLHMYSQITCLDPNNEQQQKFIGRLEKIYDKCIEQYISKPIRYEEKKQDFCFRDDKLYVPAINDFFDSDKIARENEFVEYKKFFETQKLQNFDQKYMDVKKLNFREKTRYFQSTNLQNKIYNIQQPKTTKKNKRQ